MEKIFVAEYIIYIINSSLGHLIIKYFSRVWSMAGQVESISSNKDWHFCDSFVLDLYQWWFDSTRTALYNRSVKIEQFCSFSNDEIHPKLFLIHLEKNISEKWFLSTTVRNYLLSRFLVRKVSLFRTTAQSIFSLNLWIRIPLTWYHRYYNIS